MKKRLLGILLVAVMAVSLAACGDKENAKTSGDESQGTSSVQDSGEEKESAAEGDGQEQGVAGKHHVEIRSESGGKLTRHAFVWFY